MKSIIQRLVLAIFLFINLATLMLDWQVVEGLTSKKGWVVISGNLILSVFILLLYFISLVFLNKAKKPFFIIGLCSLSMLAALEISKFETFGYFKNLAIGVYLGVGTIIVNIILYIFLLRKECFVESN
ncbi:MAG: hypothetical protein Q4E28_04030 [Clostridia bacterium]|nr:hypothetical protein [Clostridia bacterium]